MRTGFRLLIKHPPFRPILSIPTHSHSLTHINRPRCEVEQHPTSNTTNFNSKSHALPINMHTTTTLAVALAVVLTLCQTHNAVASSEAPLTLKPQSTARFAQTTPLQKSAFRAALMKVSTRKRRADGYTFDPCKYHKDCRGRRLCVSKNFRKACSGGKQCFCFIEFLQICESCDECRRYPRESCLIHPAEEEETFGFCGSSFTVYEGIFGELGCDTYPEVTPAPLSAEGKRGKPSM